MRHEGHDEEAYWYLKRLELLKTAVPADMTPGEIMDLSARVRAEPRHIIVPKSMVADIRKAIKQFGWDGPFWDHIPITIRDNSASGAALFAEYDDSEKAIAYRKKRNRWRTGVSRPGYGIAPLPRGHSGITARDLTIVSSWKWHEPETPGSTDLVEQLEDENRALREYIKDTENLRNRNRGRLHTTTLEKLNADVVARRDHDVEYTRSLEKRERKRQQGDTEIFVGYGRGYERRLEERKEWPKTQRQMPSFRLRPKRKAPPDVYIVLPKVSVQRWQRLHGEGNDEGFVEARRIMLARKKMDCLEPEQRKDKNGKPYFPGGAYNDGEGWKAGSLSPEKIRHAMENLRKPNVGSRPKVKKSDEEKARDKLRPKDPKKPTERATTETLKDWAAEPAVFDELKAKRRCLNPYWENDE
jgi:hypothetical protein